MISRNLYERSFGNRIFIIPFSILLILVMAAWLAERLDRDIRDMEVSQFNYRLKELQSLVLLMNASNAAKDMHSELKTYIGANPMLWLDYSQSSVNYIGEHQLSDVQDVRGKWVYDPDQKVIAYRSKTMSKNDLLNQLSELDDIPRIKLVGQLHKKEIDWLRFKVVRLLSKEEHGVADKGQANLSLALVQ